MTGNDAGPRPLYLLQVLVGTIPTPGGPLEFSAGCYLAETGDGRHILIDSGLPEDMPVVPGAPPAGQGKSVIEHLLISSCVSDDIDILICIHFDLDDCGHHDTLPTPSWSFSASTTSWCGADMSALPWCEVIGIIRPCATGSWMEIPSCCLA